MATNKAAVKQWTMMVYLAGDNNLDGAGLVDLGEMKKVGSTDALNVVAQFDRAGKNIQTKRYYLRKGTPLAKDVVKQLGETNMGDPAVLEDFVTWTATNYPAQHYLLVLWNHGAGWDDANLYEGEVFSGATPPVSRKRSALPLGGAKAAGGRALPQAQTRAGISRTRRALFSTTVQSAVRTRAIAFDDQAQDYLDNVELKRVIKKAKKSLKHNLDILGMDACLMSMIEVAYQMTGLVNYSVGSEEEEPGEGWPYDRILKALAANPGMAPEDLSKAIVDHYLASYGASDGVTQSAMRLGQLQPLTGAINRLAKELKVALADKSGQTAITGVRAKVQEYSRPYDDYCDLLHLCELLGKDVSNPAVKAACDLVVTAAQNVIVEAGCKGSAVKNSHGISIYFPKRRISPLYATLDFTKSTQWDEFLDAYLKSLE